MGLVCPDLKRICMNVIWPRFAISRSSWMVLGSAATLAACSNMLTYGAPADAKEEQRTTP